VSPVRQLDMVFMIDDSPSMAPKVSKLAQQFPKLLAELKDPADGRYPDLRVAIIDSDLGTGGAYPSGSCGPTASPDASKSFGDLGNFQMRGAVGCGANPDALWLDYYAHGKPASYNPTMDMSQVFGCLAGNLGALGCGQEHQLQSFEFALTAQNLHQNQSGGLQNGFLRPQAYLGLVILSDEDDCSAATNNGMFGDKPELRGESTSLRCATRAHQCNGVNLTDAPPGYPTSTKFEASFADCAARTDACPNPTDGNAATDTSGRPRAARSRTSTTWPRRSRRSRPIRRTRSWWPVSSDGRAPMPTWRMPSTRSTSCPARAPKMPTTSKGKCGTTGRFATIPTTSRPTPPRSMRMRGAGALKVGCASLPSSTNSARTASSSASASGTSLPPCGLFGDTIAMKLQNLCIDAN
jgi:hypothetical protein